MAFSVLSVVREPIQLEKPSGKSLFGCVFRQEIGHAGASREEITKHKNHNALAIIILGVVIKCLSRDQEVLIFLNYSKI